jgi:hypothetical protein
LCAPAENALTDKPALLPHGGQAITTGIDVSSGSVNCARPTADADGALAAEKVYRK